MENASKALIIAGAILISILIIGLGVFIYQQAATTVSNANLNSQEAMAHNGQFQSYIGNTESQSDVKQLMNTITANNVTGTTADTTQYIFVYFNNSSNKHATNSGLEGWYSPDEISNYVTSGYTYTIKVHNNKALTTAAEIPVETGATDPADFGGDQGYYSNGYIRCMEIIENKRGA